MGRRRCAVSAVFWRACFGAFDSFTIRCSDFAFVLAFSDFEGAVFGGFGTPDGAFAMPVETACENFFTPQSAVFQGGLCVILIFVKKYFGVLEKVRIFAAVFRLTEGERDLKRMRRKR